MSTKIKHKTRLICRVFLVICAIGLQACSNNNSDDLIEDDPFDYTNYDKELCADDFPAEYHQKCNVQQRLAIMKALEQSYDSFERDNTDAGDCMVFATNVYDLYMQDNLTIRNALTREPIIDCYNPNDESDRNKFALFTVQHLGRAQYLLILNQGRFTAIYAHFIKFDDCLTQLIEYFRKNSALDRRLLPLCVQVLTDLYVTNQLTNAGSLDQWHNWSPSQYDNQDSIAKIYYPYLRQSTSGWMKDFAD